MHVLLVMVYHASRTHKTESKSKPITFSRLEDALELGWRSVLASQFTKPYFQKLKTFLRAEHKAGARIYPPISLIFSAFNLCPFDQVRVVIIGQDPYHGPGQAMGLCFSVPRGVRKPSSLINIYKELATDIPSFQIPFHGDLRKWAQQGVLMLNTGLTVRHKQANSHKGKGWQKLTKSVVQAINAKLENVVFILWGAHAQKKIKVINADKHCIIKGVHPSGLSAHRGFFGSKPFSKTNKFLAKIGSTPIDWQV